MSRAWVVLLVALAVVTPLEAQGLRSKINELFVFGPGEDPLFLAATADPDNPAAVQAHAEHFIPAAAGTNGAIITFLTTAIGNNAASVPLSATAGGTTFRFVGGTPVQTSVSPGPIFAERAQTLGQGRVFVAATANVINLKSIRGVRLDQLQLNFTHVNADFPGCDTIFGGDCTQMGLPGLENDVIRLDLNLDVDVFVTQFLLTYGLLDRVDIGVAIPIVSTSLRGTSEAQVVPFGGPTAAHFFTGSPSNPSLGASRFVEGSATGLGDITARLKVNLSQADDRGFAVLVDGRFATGSESDLLGSGHTAIRGLGIVSGRFGEFSPHANVGYQYRSGATQNDAFLAIVGFDHLLAPWATLAVDLLSELQVGDTDLDLPETVTFDIPFRRSVDPTSIPDGRDDIVNGSLGFKFTTAPGVILVANSIWPLNRGGLRPDVLWTFGLEYNF